jgi:GntR family transcriptional repressor for pyruvate dehydrogenase complex
MMSIAQSSGPGAHGAVKAVLDYIQHGIHAGRFEGGCRLPPEAELATLVGVSRTPVREAIKVLEAAGVLEIRRGIGTFLRPQATAALGQLLLFQAHLQETTPRKLFETRLMIERTAAELAAHHRSADDLARMKAANRRLAILVEDASATLDQLAVADMTFHHTVYDACGNELIAALGRFVTALVGPWIKQSLERGGRSQVVSHHDLIIAMIELGNAGGAREAMSDRAISESLEFFQRALESPGQQQG